MKNSRVQYFLGLLALGVSYSFAAESLDSRLDTLEKEMKDVYVQNVSGTKGAGFANETNLVDDLGWYVSFDVLLWHVKSGGTDWLLRTDSSVLPFSGTILDCGFDWDWGFRVGLGKNFNQTGWDLGATYTRYHTGDGESSADDFATPSGTDGPVGNEGPSGNAEAAITCGVDLDSVDLLLGKAFFVSSNLAMHPFVGLQSTWIDQNQRIYTHSFINALETFLPVSGDVDTNLNTKSDFWGIGPKLGTDLSWYMSKNFKLLATAEAALLQGFFEVSEDQWVGVTPNGEPQTTADLNITGNIHRYVPYARMLLGLGYGTYLRDKKNYFDVSLNYEISYFWRVNQFIDSEDSQPATINISSEDSIRLNLSHQSEDLGFYGVTLKFKYQF